MFEALGEFCDYLTAVAIGPLNKHDPSADQPVDVGVIVPVGGLADSPVQVRKLA